MPADWLCVRKSSEYKKSFLSTQEDESVNMRAHMFVDKRTMVLSRQNSY